MSVLAVFDPCVSKERAHCTRHLVADRRTDLQMAFARHGAHRGRERGAQSSNVDHAGGWAHLLLLSQLPSSPTGARCGKKWATKEATPTAGLPMCSTQGPCHRSRPTRYRSQLRGPKIRYCSPEVVCCICRSTAREGEREAAQGSKFPALGYAPALRAREKPHASRVRPTDR